MTTQTTPVPRDNAIGSATHQFLTQLVRTLRWHEFPFATVPAGTVLVPKSKVCINDPGRAIERLSEIIRKDYAFPALSGVAFESLAAGQTRYRVTETGGYHHRCPHDSSVRSGHPWFPILSDLVDDARTKPDSSYYAYPCLLPGDRDSKDRPTWSPYVATTMSSPWDHGVADLVDHDYFGERQVYDDPRCVSRVMISVQTFAQFNQLAVQTCCPQWADIDVIDRNREPWQAQGGVPLWPEYDLECESSNALCDIGRAKSEAEAYRECRRFGEFCHDRRKLKKKVSEVTGSSSLPLESEYETFPFDLRMKIMRLITDTARAEYLDERTPRDTAHK